MAERGRPTEKTEANVQKIVDALRAWMTRQSACAHAGISKATFYNRIEADPDFLDLVEDSEEYWIGIVENQKRILIEDKAYRPAIEKELKSKRREVYWDKQEIEQRNINTEVPLEQMSDEDLLKYVKQQ